MYGDPLEPELLLACERAIGNGEMQTLQTPARLRQVLRDADPTKGRAEAAAALVQYLIAKNKIDFRLVLRQKGLHHEKIRIARDPFGDHVITVGSDNDTLSALSGGNRETGTLIASWQYPGTNYWNTHGKPHIDLFYRTWANDCPDSITITLSEQVKFQITSDWEQRGLSVDQLRSILLRENKKSEGQSKELRSYQESAIENWQQSNYQGVMALCTGAGKTFTAIKAASLLDAYFIEQGESFALIVAVPYKILADQWQAELEEHFDHVIPCWSDHPEWKNVFSAAAFSAFDPLRPRTSFATVVVNDSLQSEFFQTSMKAIPLDNLMFVGDEVHRHGAERFQSLIPKARFKLGLSATPWSFGEEEREEIIRSLYGDIIAQFGLGDALKETVLCNYHYTLSEVYLNDPEIERYKEIASSMAALSSNKRSRTKAEETEFRSLIRKRNAILGTCENKVAWLRRYAKGIRKKQTLIYCSEGNAQEAGEDTEIRALNHVAYAFRQAGWELAKITAAESTAKRNETLLDFQEGTIDGILAIRVLDEGFDLPACRTAFLLSSSRNERQFIQRRGRVLRQSAGKDTAHIYDFAVLPPEDHAEESWAQSLALDEFIRAWEFSRYSLQKDSLAVTIQGLCDRYKIDFDMVRNMVESRSYTNEEEC